MKFRKYDSIENSYRQKYIEKLRHEGYDKGLWSVTEKIHGANFSIVANQDEIRAAKRTAFITEEDNFFGNHWVEILNTMKTRISALLFACQNDFECESVTIYGELFGGKYNHPDVEKSNQKSIQAEVQYSPDHQFIAYDLMVGNYFLPWNKAKQILDQFGIACVDELFRGTFDECLLYSNEFLTTIPRYFGLPDIEGNLCEGTVLKPVDTAPFLYDNNRVILKNKNDKFKEKHGDFKGGTPKISKPLPENVKKLVLEIQKYATPQRLANVISKFGEPKQSDFGPLMKELNQDAYEEFLKDFEEEILLLDKKDVTIVRKKLGGFNAGIIKNYMRENV